MQPKLGRSGSLKTFERKSNDVIYSAPCTDTEVESKTVRKMRKVSGLALRGFRFEEAQRQKQPTFKPRANSQPATSPKRNYVSRISCPARRQFHEELMQRQAPAQKQSAAQMPKRRLTSMMLPVHGDNHKPAPQDQRGLRVKASNTKEQHTLATTRVCNSRAIVGHFRARPASPPRRPLVAPLQTASTYYPGRREERIPKTHSVNRCMSTSRPMSKRYRKLSRSEIMHIDICPITTESHRAIRKPLIPISHELPIKLITYPSFPDVPSVLKSNIKGYRSNNTSPKFLTRFPQREAPAHASVVREKPDVKKSTVSTVRKTVRSSAGSVCQTRSMRNRSISRL